MQRSGSVIRTSPKTGKPMNSSGEEIELETVQMPSGLWDVLSEFVLSLPPEAFVGRRIGMREVRKFLGDVESAKKV